MQSRRQPHKSSGLSRPFVSLFNDTFSLLHHVRPIAESQSPGFGDIGIQSLILFQMPFSRWFMCLHVFPFDSAPALRPVLICNGVQAVTAFHTAYEFAFICLPVNHFAADYARRARRCFSILYIICISLLDALPTIFTVLVALRRRNKRFTANSAGNRFSLRLFHVITSYNRPCCSSRCGTTWPFWSSSRNRFSRGNNRFT